MAPAAEPRRRRKRRSLPPAPAEISREAGAPRPALDAGTTARQAEPPAPPAEPTTDDAEASLWFG